jgi:hypothetical protein
MFFQDKYIFKTLINRRKNIMPNKYLILNFITKYFKLILSLL